MNETRAELRPGVLHTCNWIYSSYSLFLWCLDSMLWIIIGKRIFQELKKVTCSKGTEEQCIMEHAWIYDGWQESINNDIYIFSYNIYLFYFLFYISLSVVYTILSEVYQYHLFFHRNMQIHLILSDKIRWTDMARQTLRIKLENRIMGHPRIRKMQFSQCYDPTLSPIYHKLQCMASKNNLTSLIFSCSHFLVQCP